MALKPNKKEMKSVYKKNFNFNKRIKIKNRQI